MESQMGAAAFNLHYSGATYDPSLDCERLMNSNGVFWMRYMTAPGTHCERLPTSQVIQKLR